MRAHDRPQRRAVARSAVIDWHTTSLDDRDPLGAHWLRVRVRRVFRGDLAGESTGELLVYVPQPHDPDSHAVYVGRERVRGRLGRRRGTFVLQYEGVTGDAAPERSRGRIISRSGTGALAGINGGVEFSGDAVGPHSLTLTYQLDEGLRRSNIQRASFLSAPTIFVRV